MIDVKGPYRIGAAFVALSALLHLVAPLFGGLNAEAGTLFVIGLVYLVGSYGLLRGMRWLAYLAFIVMIAGSIAALASTWGLSPVPDWLYLSVFAVNWLAVLGLFLALWRPRPAPA